MQDRWRIPRELVMKYKSEITFLASRDNNYIEVVEIRIAWLLELPYEVSSKEVENNIDTLLKLEVNPNKERFESTTEILNKIIKEKFVKGYPKRMEKLYQKLNLPIVEDVFGKLASRRTRLVTISPPVRIGSSETLARYVTSEKRGLRPKKNDARGKKGPKLMVEEVEDNKINEEVEKGKFVIRKRSSRTKIKIKDDESEEDKVSLNERKNNFGIYNRDPNQKEKGREEERTYEAKGRRRWVPI